MNVHMIMMVVNVFHIRTIKNNGNKGRPVPVISQSQFIGICFQCFFQDV